MAIAAADRDDRRRRPRSTRSPLPARRLANVFELSKLLLDFETLEQTLDQAFVIMTRTLPVRSAILVENAADRPKMAIWASEGVRPAQLRDAVAHAEQAYSYLAGGTVRAFEQRPGSSVLPRWRARHAAGQAHRFIVLPLIVVGRPLIGAIQLEVGASSDEADLVLVSAFVNQLALAFDRHNAPEPEVVERQLVEQACAAPLHWQPTERAHTAADRSTDTSRTLVDDFIHAFAWECDAQTLATSYVSAGVEGLLGFSRSGLEERSRGWLEHVHPDDETIVRDAFRKVLLEHDLRCEHRCVANDGREVWLDTGVHLANADTGLPRFRGLSVDVTALKRAEERALDRPSFVVAMAASLTDGLIATDADGRVRFFNPAAEELLGWSEKEALDTVFTDVVRVQDAAGMPVESPLDRVLRTTKSLESDAHFWIRRDGVAIPVRYRAMPIRRGGPLTGIVLSFQRVTDGVHAGSARSLLTEAYKAIASSLDYKSTLEQVARLALPSLGDACVVDVISAGGRLERVAWAHVDPHKQADLAATLRFPPEPEHLTHPVCKALRTGRTLLIDDMHDPRLRDFGLGNGHFQQLGELGPRSLLTVPMRLGERQVGAMTFWFGESARRHGPAEQALGEELAVSAASALHNGRLYEQAQRAVRAREQILGIVSHDLRSPLSTVLMIVHLLETTSETQLRQRLPEALGRMRRSADRMHRLIDDLLDFSSIEAGRLSLAPEPHDPAVILAEVAASMERSAQHNQFRVLLDVAPKLPTVWCDRDRVLQVLFNLADNAIKVTPREGTITLGAEQRGDEVVFMVQDTGPGIAPEDLHRIFERYRRGKHERYKGTGLGLDIARGIVEAHGGRIWVETTPGQGSAFRFTIHVAPGEPQPA